MMKILSVDTEVGRLLPSAASLEKKTKPNPKSKIKFRIHDEDSCKCTLVFWEK